MLPFFRAFVSRGFLRGFCQTLPLNSGKKENLSIRLWHVKNTPKMNSKILRFSRYSKVTSWMHVFIPPPMFQCLSITKLKW